MPGLPLPRARRPALPRGPARRGGDRSRHPDAPLRFLGLLQLAWLADARDAGARVRRLIIYEDLLRLAIERLEPAARRRLLGFHRPAGWLRRLFRRRRAPESVAGYRRRAICPACRQTTDAEERYLGAALQFVDDEQFASAYERSQGLCVPHVMRALELGAGNHHAGTLVARTLPKWAELRRDLAGFVGKHDHRRRQPFTEAEGTAYLRAFETLVGAPGVFGNQAHGAGRPDDAPRSADGSG